MRPLIFIALLVAAGAAGASSFDGAVDEVVIGPSQTQSGYIRIGIRVAAHSSPSAQENMAIGYFRGIAELSRVVRFRVAIHHNRNHHDHFDP